MSVKAITWALEQEIDDPVSHLLLINLADYADREHKCWPGQEALAKRLRRSVDAVQRHLAKLEASGHINRRPRRNSSGHRTSNLYLLNVEVSVRVTAPTADVSQGPKPHGCGVAPSRKTRSPKPQTPASPKPHAGCGRNQVDKNHQIEPGRLRAKASNLNLKSEGAVGAKPDPLSLIRYARSRGPQRVEQALKAISHRSFASQAEADLALEAALREIRHRSTRTVEAAE